MSYKVLNILFCMLACSFSCRLLTLIIAIMLYVANKHYDPIIKLILTLKPGDFFFDFQTRHPHQHVS